MEMDAIYADDVSYIDIDELGVRPWSIIDNANEFEQFANLLTSNEKLSDENQFKLYEKNLELYNDESFNYEIDPETGEKIFYELPASTSSSTRPSSNDKWVGEYLSNIELSSSNNQSGKITPILTQTTSGFSFENSNTYTENQTDSYWLSDYTNSHELENNIMYSSELLTNQSIPSHRKPYIQNTTMAVPTRCVSLPSKTDQDISPNNSSMLNDDDYSISNSSTYSRKAMCYFSLESDSATRDSETTYDRLSFQPKMEKMDPDEHLISNLSVRRSSTRSISQFNQDEEMLQKYNIPLSVYDITQSSTEEYNHHLAHFNHLSQEQMHIIKDIRRRGKNKIAAQNCRKRKASNVEKLAHEVDRLKRTKNELEELKKSYQKEIIETRTQYEYLHQQVLPDRQLPPAISVK